MSEAFSSDACPPPVTEAEQSAESQAEGQYLQNLDVRVVVFSLRDDRLKVLLVPYRSFEGGRSDPARWELPGSRVPVWQSLEATATVCLLQLTGLREAYLEQLYTYGEVPRGEPAQRAGATTELGQNLPIPRLVTVVYFAIIPAGAAQTHGTSSNKDEWRAKWFPVDELPFMVLEHREVLAYALRRLRYKLEYTAVGFQLLPEQFSLSELQKVYEMILGERLDKRNFRRRILQAGIIEETQHLRSGEGRPARLYHYRPDAVAEVKARRLFP